MSATALTLADELEADEMSRKGVERKLLKCVARLTVSSHARALARQNAPRLDRRFVWYVMHSLARPSLTGVDEKDETRR